MKKEYINGNKQNGIKYDFNEINKLFKSLNIPKDVYNPVHLPFESCSGLSLSPRDREVKQPTCYYMGCVSINCIIQEYVISDHRSL